MKTNNLDTSSQSSPNNFSINNNTSSLYDIENDIFIPISSQDDEESSPLTLGFFVNSQDYSTLSQKDVISFLDKSYSDLDNFSDIFLTSQNKPKDFEKC